MIFGGVFLAQNIVVPVFGDGEGLGARVGEGPGCEVVVRLNAGVEDGFWQAAASGK